MKKPSKIKEKIQYYKALQGIKQMEIDFKERINAIST